MPSAVHLQSAGAVDRVMRRGDRREAIFLDEMNQETRKERHTFAPKNGLSPSLMPQLPFRLMKIIAIFFLLSITASAEVIPSPPVEKSVNLLYANLHDPQNFNKAMDGLSPVEKEQVLQYLRSVMSDPIWRWEKSQTLSILIEMGDDKSIADAVRSYPGSAYGGESELRSSLQPKVIPALAPLMFGADTKIVRGPDTVYWPTPSVAGFNIENILEKSPVFSPAVKKWLSSLPQLTLVQERDMMRKWWTANQRYFYAGNYAAVQPGELPPGTSPSPTPNTWIGPTPYPPPAATASPVLVATSAHSSPVATVPPTNPFLLPGVIGLVALFGAGTALFLRQRK